MNGGYQNPHGSLVAIYAVVKDKKNSQFSPNVAKILKYADGTCYVACDAIGAYWRIDFTKNLLTKNQPQAGFTGQAQGQQQRQQTEFTGSQDEIPF